MRVLLRTLFTVGAFCALSGTSMSMQLNSLGITEGKIAKKHACKPRGGENQSIPLKLSAIPREAKYLAVIMDDPDAKSVVGYTWVHWNVFNIPVDGAEKDIKGGLPNGKIAGSDMGTDQKGKKRYKGMCPPNGKHVYRIAIFALKEKIDVSDEGLTIERFSRKNSEKIISKSIIKGSFTGWR